MQELIGKIVDVLTSETTYTGKLVEIGETEVYLESDAGWVVVPVEKVMSISESEKNL